MPAVEVATLAKLKDQGWFLTEEGLEICTEEWQNSAASKRKDGRGPDRSPTVDEIIAVAKNINLEAIGSSVLKNFLKQKTPSEQGGARKSGSESVVLQIQKIRNISAPKINENSTTAPRMLRVHLTDGPSSIQALEIENVPGLNLNLPPGTKVRVKLPEKSNSDVMTPGAYVNNYLLLGPKMITVLGGRVEDLAEKWELTRSVTAQSRMKIKAMDGEGPPPWIPFGTRAPQLNVDRNFKALPKETAKQGEKGEGAVSELNQEFENQRRATIEAVTKGTKKVFAGPGPKQAPAKEKDQPKPEADGSGKGSRNADTSEKRPSSRTYEAPKSGATPKPDQGKRSSGSPSEPRNVQSATSTKSSESSREEKPVSKNDTYYGGRGSSFRNSSETGRYSGRGGGEVGSSYASTRIIVNSKAHRQNYEPPNRRDQGEGGYRSRDQGEGGYRQRDQGDGYRQRDQGDGGYRQRDQGDGGYRQRDQGESGYRQRDQGESGYRQRDQGEDGYRQRDRGEGGYRQRDQADSGYRPRDRQEEGDPKKDRTKPDQAKETKLERQNSKPAIKKLMDDPVVAPPLINRGPPNSKPPLIANEPQPRGVPKPPLIANEPKHLVKKPLLPDPPEAQAINRQVAQVDKPTPTPQPPPAAPSPKVEVKSPPRPQPTPEDSQKDKKGQPPPGFDKEVPTGGLEVNNSPEPQQRPSPKPVNAPQQERQYQQYPPQNSGRMPPGFAPQGGPPQQQLPPKPVQNFAAQTNVLQQQFQQMGLMSGQNHQPAPIPAQVVQQQQQRYVPQPIPPKVVPGMPPPGFAPVVPGQPPAPMPYYPPGFTAPPIPQVVVSQPQVVQPGAPTGVQAAAAFQMQTALLQQQQQQFQALVNAMTSNAAAAAVMRPTFKPGDVVMAKYWEDQKFYRATIYRVTERGYQVHFMDYGNLEEVAPQDVFLSGTAEQPRPVVPGAAAPSQNVSYYYHQ